MQRESTLIEAKMSRQTVQIYEILLKYGYPFLLSSRILQTSAQIESYLAQHLQPSPKRETLIEWLILQIYPLYSQQPQLRGGRKKKIMNHLWRLGVMPFSKHTKNLDYEKYVDGLLGMENAINLVHTLCVMLKETRQFAKAKNDTNFTSFMKELIVNFGDLVNADYDPYKISFPSAYSQLSDEEFNAEYEAVMTQIESLRMLDEEDLKKDRKENECEVVFREFEETKERFKRTYGLLVEKMREVTSRHESTLKYWKKSQNEEGRMVKISPDLPKLYKQYKQSIKLAPYISSQLQTQREQISALFQTLNDTVII